MWVIGTHGERASALRSQPKPNKWQGMDGILPPFECLAHILFGQAKGFSVTAPIKPSGKKSPVTGAFNTSALAKPKASKTSGGLHQLAMSSTPRCPVCSKLAYPAESIKVRGATDVDVINACIQQAYQALLHLVMMLVLGS
jgi:hypothetical protein